MCVNSIDTENLSISLGNSYISLGK